MNKIAAASADAFEAPYASPAVKNQECSARNKLQ